MERVSKLTIKAVLFDLDDTLLWDERSVQESFEETCLEAAKSYDIDVDALEEAVRDEARKLYASYDTYDFTLNIGINPFEGLWANFNDEQPEPFRRLKQIVPEYRAQSWTRGLSKIGIEDPILGSRLGDYFAAVRRTKPYVYDDTYEVLEQLKEKFKLLLLTNGSPDLQHEKLAGVPNLAPYFDHIVISGGFGQGKPAPAIFEHCMSLLDIQAEEGIMVGDKLTTDIKGAVGVGMTATWLNRHQIERTDEIVPDYEIQGLRELYSLIETINES